MFEGKIFRRFLGTLLSLVWVLGWGEAAWASVAVKGMFVAERDCEAFISKNDQTNPDALRLVPREAYPLIEVNKPGNFDWVRVRVAQAGTQERWVEASCGELDLEDGTVPPEVEDGQSSGACSANRCNQPNQEDSFVLALSWQPAFCKTAAGSRKPECQNGTPGIPSNRFTLHGLWPNRSTCGTHYGYCGSVCNAPKKNGATWMCQYPAVPAGRETMEQLATVMPSVVHGSCLERHEWFKHGTCSGMNADDYLSLAARLTHLFNDAGIAEFMAKSSGRQVSERDFLKVVDRGLGQGASRKIKLSCQGNNLVDVQILLPPDLSNVTSLKDEIARVKPGFSSNCKGKFTVVAPASP